MEIESFEPGTPCWVDLGSPDPAAAADFYSGLLGWDVVDQAPTRVGTGWRSCAADRALGCRMAVCADATGAPFSIWQPRDDRWPADVPSHWMAYFAVEDTGAVAARAQELGATILVPPPTSHPVGSPSSTTPTAPSSASSR